MCVNAALSSRTAHLQQHRRMSPSLSPTSFCRTLTHLATPPQSESQAVSISVGVSFSTPCSSCNAALGAAVPPPPFLSQAR